MGCAPIAARAFGFETGGDEHGEELLEARFPWHGWQKENKRPRENGRGREDEQWEGGTTLDKERGEREMQRKRERRERETES